MSTLPSSHTSTNNNTNDENNNNDIAHNNNNNENNNKPDENNNNAPENNNTNKANNVLPDSPWGDRRTPLTDDDTSTLRIYSQNLNGIYDRDGTGLDEAFHAIRTTGSTIFTFQETHGDKLNLKSNGIMRKSARKVWRDQHCFCSIATSSTSSPVDTFSKAGGVLAGVTGNLHGRIRSKIEDVFGRWCGFNLIGKEGKEIMVLTVYNVSQDRATGNDTLYNQQQAQYLLHYNLHRLKSNREQYIDPKQRFVTDLLHLLRDASAAGKDIILTGDFNDTIGESHNALTLAILEIGLQDVIAIQHGFDTNIATYKRGPRRIDYVFVSRRILNHVNACGYDRFDEILCSDHRAYYLDLSIPGLFGNDLPILCSPANRTIRGDQPSNVTKYIKFLANYIEEHNLIQKATQLQHQCYFTADDANQLDALVTRGMLLAESKCRQAYRLPWTKETHEIMTATNILRSCISAFRNRIDLPTSVDKKMATLTTKFNLPTTLDEANTMLRASQKKSRRIKKETTAYQSKAYEEREEAFVEIHRDTMGTKKAKIIFRRGEDTKQMMKTLPKTKHNGGALMRIEVPIPTEGDTLQYMEITDGPTIERLLLDRNIRHFRQAEGTPLASSDCIDAIGFGGTSPLAQELLQGDGNLDNITTDAASQLFLSEMKQTTASINITLTKEEMMNRYKGWSEGTTTSIGSGRHLGHFAALWRPFQYKQPAKAPINPYDKNKRKQSKKKQQQDTADEYEVIDDQRQSIINLHHLMLQIAIKNRHVYQRWLDIITQMLEKDPGSPKIFRLRVIHLYECDYNLLLGIYFRALQQHLEDTNRLNDGCFGGRPNRRAIDPVLIDVTQTEIAMVTRRPLIRFNNDMKSCFDRIMAHIALLNIQSYGMPQELASIMGDFLQFARYYVKTGIGVSTTSYSHSNDSPVFGTGQGSTASMYIWGTLVSRLVDIHERVGHGAAYSYPDGNNGPLLDIVIAILSFVDDCNLSNTGEKHETVKDILQRTQADAQLWNDLIRSSGGALQLTKCFMQVLRFVFATNGAPVIDTLNDSCKVTLTDRNTDRRIIINPISPYTTYKSLGTHQGISERSHAQFHTLHKKTLPLLRALVGAPVTPHQAFLHHSLCFVPSIGYPLSVCHLSQSQLHQLQAPYLSILRNKLRLPRSHPKALMFGPRSHGGLGTLDLRIEAGLGGIDNIVRNLRSPGKARSIINIFLHKWQHASGMSLPLLEYPSIHAPHLEGHYYVYIRQFLAIHQLSLEVYGLTPALPPRENDECIMDVACDSAYFTDQEIRQIYYCKSYLEVFWLSDMCTADGEQLLAGPYEGIRSYRTSASKMEEIIQERPNDATWLVWRRFLRCHFIHNDKDIRIPLGCWLINSNDMKRLWVFYYSKNYDQLYRGYRRYWHSHDKYSYDIFNRIMDTEYFSYTANKLPGPIAPTRQLPNDMITSLPIDAVPCDVNDGPEGWEICEHYPYVHPTEPTLNPLPVCFEDALDSQPQYIRQYYAHIEFYPQAHKHQHSQSLFDFLTTNHTLHVATDGGADKGVGSLGFVFSDSHLNRFCHSWGQAAGNKPDSFRTEVCAALAALKFLQLYYEYWSNLTNVLDIITAPIIIHTDSESMIRKLKKMMAYPGAPASMVMDADYDVLRALYQQLHWFPTTPEFKWVPSHQDDDTNDISSLTIAAQLNIHADELATIGLRRLLPSPFVPMNPATFVQLHHTTGTITKRLSHTVRQICNLPALREYYLTNYHWSLEDFNNVDWTIFTPVYRKHSKKNQAWTHKNCMRKLPTGSRMHRNGGNEESQCSSCRQAFEDDDHLVQCTSRPKFRRKIEDALATLKDGMCPTLYNLFHTSVLNYLDGHDCNMACHTIIDATDPTFHEYNTLLTQQSRIGWDHLLRGKLSILWRQYQHHFECTQRMNRNTNSISIPWTSDETDNSSSASNSLDSSLRSTDTDLYSLTSNDSTSSSSSLATIPPITFQSDILPLLSPDSLPEPKPKKKRRTDRFQQFIDSVLHAMHQELWIDRCNDRHRRIEGNCDALDTKVNRDVEDLYCKEDQTRYEDRDTFFDLTLHERLQLPTYRKQQWVKRWQKNIATSVRRAMIDTTIGTKKIFTYFNCTKKPAKKVNKRRL